MRGRQYCPASAGLAGLLHADTHPGNFLLLPDGRLGVLDYGAVNRLPDGLPEGLARVLGAAAHGDAEELVEVLRGSVSVDAEAVRGFVDRFLGPLHAEEFTFSRDWMRAREPLHGPSAAPPQDNVQLLSVRKRQGATHGCLPT